MSTTIDERIVSMQFDNKKFESNVATTMSTLDKLKQKLNLTGSAKGLENVSAAAKKVDMTSLGSAVDTVRTRFSALEVMGVTALANITNSAVNAGKRIVSALTIDPIKTGFQEYETQINAVQTILANTESKGTTIDDVNEALETLNTYADKTIYNFTEMTRNIGTFTAAGVDLDTSVNAIQGIANLAAVSGSTSQQASTAMYQLSQALASGTVKLMDWNSVVNAGMGGQVFQDALKETARIHGVAIDDMIEKQGSFRETLSEGWLTSEILTETLQKFTLTTEGLTEEQIKANREMLKAKGYTEDQIDEIFKLGETATNAATKVKTFTQLWDVMKEAAQSGWSKTWKLIIGDFEGAKNLLTPLSDFLTGVINKISDARNALLEGALGRGFTRLADNVKDLVKPLGNTIETVEKITSTVGDLGEVVNKVIHGDFGNGEDRFVALSEAGINYYKVQNKVNEKLGDSFRYTKEQIEAQDKLLGSKKGVTDQTKEQSEATSKESGEMVKLTESTKRQLVALSRMSDAQLEQKGYTKDQIEAIRELDKEAEKLGLTTGEFIMKLDEINGRWLLINSFKNIGQGITAVVKSIGDAWKAIFDPITSEHIYNIIAGFHKLTTYLTVSDEAADKFKRTFKGIFAAVDIVLTLINGPAKIAFRVLKEVLSAFDLNILDVTASIGDAIVKFRDWIDGIIESSGVFTKISDTIVGWIRSIKDWIDGLKDVENVPKAIGDALGSALANGLLNAFDFIKNAINQVTEWIRSGFSQIPEFINSGFVGGIWNGIKSVAQAMWDFATAVIETFCEVLGINSPSKAMTELGENTIEGFTNGIQNGFGSIIEVIKSLLSGIVEAFKNFNLSDISTVLLSFGSIFPQTKIFGFLSGIARLAMVAGETFLAKLKEVLGINSPSKETTKIGEWTMEGFLISIKNFASKVWTTVKNVFTAVITNIKEVFQNFDFGQFLAATFAAGIIFAVFKISNVLEKLAAPLEGLGDLLSGAGKALSGFGSYLHDLGKAKKMNAIGKMILNIAIAIGILAASLFVLSKIPVDGLKQAGNALAQLAVVVLILAGAAAVMSKFGGEGTVNVLPIIALTLGLLIVASALKKIASIPADDLDRSMETIFTLIAGIAATIIAFSLISKVGGGVNVRKLGGTLLGMAAAMLIMTFVIKRIDSLDGSAIAKGLFVISSMTALFVAVIGISQYAGEHAAKAGRMLLMMSGAFLIMTAVIKIIASIPDSDIDKGLKIITRIGLIFAAAIGISKFAGENAAKAGFMLLSMAASLWIVAEVIKIIAGIDDGGLKRGLAVVTGLEILFGALMVVSKFAGENAAKAGAMLVTMSVALLVVSGAIFILSNLPTDGLWRAVGIVTIVMALFGGLIYATKYATDCKGALITLTVVLGLLVGALVGLSFIKAERLLPAAAALSAVMVAFAGMVAALHFVKTGEKTFKRTLGMLAALTGVVVVLGAVIYALSTIKDPSSVLTSVGGLTVLLMAITASLAILSNTKTMSKEKLSRTIIMLGAMTVVISLLSGILALMSALNVQNAIPNATALSILATVMTGLMFILSNVGKNSKSAVKGALSLTAMAVPLAVFAGVISDIPDISGKENALITLTAVMTAMTLLLGALAVIGKLASWNSLIGVLALTSMVAPLIAFAWAISWIPDISGAKANLLALTTVMTAMTLLLIPLSIIGAMGMAGLPFMGVLALTAMVVPLCAFAWAISKIPDITGSIANIILLTSVMYSMTSLLVPLSLIGFLAVGAIAGIAALTAMIVPLTAFAIAFKLLPDITGSVDNIKLLTNVLDVLSDILVKIAWVGPLALIGVAALRGLSALMIGFGVFATAIGAYMTCLPFLKKFLSTGIDVMIQIAEGLGEMIGKFVTAIASEVLTILPMLGASLSAFWSLAQPFITGVSQLDKSLLEGTGYLTGAIIALGVASFIEGIANLRGAGLIGLGVQLSGFIAAAKPFLTAVSKLDPSIMDGVKSLSEAVLIFTGASFLDGISNFFSKITGSNTSLSSFGEQLKGFGVGIAGFAKSVSGLDESSLNAMKVSAEAGKTLAEMAKTFPNSGGWLGKIMGENDADTFGAQLKAFGECLMAYGKAVSGIDQYIDSIEASAKAGKALTELADSIPDSGGWLAAVMGDNTMDEFGTQLEGFGASLLAYGKAVAGIDEYIESIEASASAGGALAELADSVPNSGGWLGAIAGDNTMDEFGAQLEAFGKSIMAYGYAVADLSSVSGAIQGSTGIVSTVVAICNKIKDELNFDWGEDEITKVGNGLYSFAIGITRFATAMTTVGDLESHKATVEKAVSIVNYVKDNLAWDNGEAEIVKLGDRLRSVGESLVSYCTSLSSVGDISTTKANIESAVGLVNYVKDNLTWDNGKAEIVKLGDSLKSFGAALASYAADLSTVGDISSSVANVEILLGIVNDVKNNFTDDKGAALTGFGANIRTLGKDIQAFGSNIGDVGDISGATDMVDEMLGMISSIKSGFTSDDSDTIKNFGKAMKNIASSVDSESSTNVSKLALAIDDLVSSLSGLEDAGVNALDSLTTKLGSAATDMSEAIVDNFAKSYPKFVKAGLDAMKQFVKGITGARALVLTATSTLAGNAAGSIATITNYMKFYAAGGYLGSGLVAGINSKKTAVYNAAYALGQKAVQGEKDGQESESPSKATIRAGKWLGEGLVIGMKNMFSAVYASGNKLGETATNTISSAVSSISDMVSSDIDVQPTIRPVLDLSDVRSGASSINGMFSGRTLSVNTRTIGAVSAMMADYQNGNNSNDVVSAIKGLRKDLNNMPRNNYNINGITYDDGSNIADAVGTLVRAAKIGRRV